MSSIASFIKVPLSAIKGLSDAAVPKKRWFGAPKDTFDDYVRKHGQEAAEYRSSGYVLATLLPYLQEKRQIDLMHSAYDKIAESLTDARQATYFIFTPTHRSAFLPLLDVSLFSEDELREYYNELN